jgi:MFS family permease
MHWSPAKLLRVFLPFALGYFLSYLYRTVNAVIAPDLVNDLGLAPVDLGLLTSAYFLSFAAFQLPLGLLLDRFGPRRVEAGLLLFAALGAVLFGRAETLGGLLLGRALIGLGVSACLMAAFKAFVIWVPAERLPMANGVQMVSGGLGALMATVPVEAALQVTDWRMVFIGLGLLTLLAAAAVFFIVPEQPAVPSGESPRQQLRGIADIFASRFFWRLAPWAIISQATYLAVLGLWSGPWLRDVAGYDRDAVANSLFLIALAMIVGYFSFGALAERLSRRGIKPLTVAVRGMSAFILVQGLLLVARPPLTIPLWLLFSGFGTAGILPYAVLAQHFPARLSGRATTALNLLVFVAAFVAQWGIGAIIGIWPETPAGGYDPAGYRAAFGLLVVLQVIAAGWFMSEPRSAPDQQEHD